MPTIVQQARSFAEIQEYLVGGSLDLFRTYGLTVEHSVGTATVDIQGPAVMAVIGYAASTIRGAVLLLTSRAVVAALQPREIQTSSPNEAMLRDVLGEFSNMLIGRLKNQLVTRGVVPMVATPTTVFGDDLMLPAPTSGMSAWHKFASPLGALFVRLDATFEKEFALAPVDGDVAAPLTEGDMAFF